jgi:IS1 family transposase
MANQLPIAKRVQILQMLCEGSSMRSISRVCDVSLNTVSKLLEDAGEACLDLHDKLVRDLKSVRVEADEIWSFVHTKDKNKAKAKSKDPEHGDVWTWTAIDHDSRLMISYLAGTRSYTSGEAFMQDLASRLGNRIQLDTDGYGVYVKGVDRVFRNRIDHAVLNKIYSNVKAAGQNRYAPLECVGVNKSVGSGKPDLESASTPYVERAKLTMRMGICRFTRLTNAHSKKYQNHVYDFHCYNFARIHKTLRVTPAIQAGISDHVWDME